MKRFILAPEAINDIREIRAYLKREASLSVAQSIVRRFREAIVFLGNSPEAGHLREDLTDEPVKFWSVYSYLIVYNPMKRPIEIVRVLHGSRDISAIFNDEQ